MQGGDAEVGILAPVGHAGGSLGDALQAGLCGADRIAALRVHRPPGCSVGVHLVAQTLRARGLSSQVGAQGIRVRHQAVGQLICTPEGGHQGAAIGNAHQAAGASKLSRSVSRIITRLQARVRVT